MDLQDGTHVHNKAAAFQMGATLEPAHQTAVHEQPPMSTAEACEVLGAESVSIVWQALSPHKQSAQWMEAVGLQWLAISKQRRLADMASKCAPTSAKGLRCVTKNRAVWCFPCYHRQRFLLSCTQFSLAILNATSPHSSESCSTTVCMTLLRE